MKNILAENMLRFGTKNLSESAKLILTEQDESFWATVPLQGKTEDSGKMVTKTYAANNPLMDGKNKVLGFGPEKADGTFNMPMYIGATLQASYNKLVQWPTTNPIANAGKFGYILNFILTDTKGKSNFTAGSNTFYYFEIRCTGKSPGKFTLITNPSPSVDSAAVKKGVFWRISDSVKASNMLLGNLDGWMGTLRTDINTDLVKMGFAEIPNTLKSAMDI
jgi:hypothetical protein